MCRLAPDTHFAALLYHFGGMHVLFALGFMAKSGSEFPH